jgi:Flp pilus assembly pilin Flp
MTMLRRLTRRGVSVAQYVLVAAAIFLVIVVGMATMGTKTNTKLNQSASDVANPQQLTTRFGS